MKSTDFTIIIDTREQQPWTFNNHTVANRKLDTGDYSIEGLENILCIERKKSASEFANNIVESRFKDVLMRMNQLKYSFIKLKYSAGPNLNASSVKGGANAAKINVPTVPAKKEPKPAAANAGPARPLRAIW